MSEEPQPVQISFSGLIWHALCPCCCSNPMDSLMDSFSNPPDALKLPPEEAKIYVDQMQGMTLFL